MEDDSRVVVRRVTDATTAEMMCAALESAGIAATADGAQTSALFGSIHGAWAPVLIRVPSSQREEAERILDALAEGPEEIPPDDGEEMAAPEEGAAPYRGRSRERDDGAAPRLKRVAVVLAFICPGGANFYAQHHILGLALFGLVVQGFLAPVSPALLIGWPVAFVLDVWTGLGSVARHNAGTIMRPRDQFLVGLTFWILTTGIVVAASA